MRNLLVVLLIIIVLGGIFLIYTDNTSSAPIQSSVDVKSYEQGLWDGFNRTMEYLHDHDYLIDGNIQVEITELDSVLHSTK